MKGNNFCQGGRKGGKKGRPRTRIKHPDFRPAMPLRHIELIVIWEGNYKSDILNIGSRIIILKKIQKNILSGACSKTRLVRTSGSMDKLFEKPAKSD
jgi:hypothetical protein